MIAIKKIKEYLNKTHTDIAFVIVLMGLFLSAFISYAWVVSILACFFIKEDQEQGDL